jgi:methionine sulfoxide reductase heme-binding subunit
VSAPAAAGRRASATRGLHGWPVAGWLCGAALALFAAVLAMAGTDEAGLRVLVRSTVRVSFTLFVAAYVAGPAAQLWPSPATRWLRVQRRQVGVSFAFAHGLHAVAIGLLAVLLGDAFEVALPALVFGGMAYVLVFAMAATSSDHAVALLGPPRWRALHRFGLHYVWGIFALAWTPRGLESPVYALFALATWGALALRIAARRRGRARRGGAR